MQSKTEVNRKNAKGLSSRIVSPCSSSEAAMFCSSSGTKSCLERFGLTFTGNVLPRHLFRLPEASILKKPILILTSISLAFDFVLTAFSLRPLRLKSGRTLRFFPFLKSSNPMVLLQFVDSFCFTLWAVLCLCKARIWFGTTAKHGGFWGTARSGQYKNWTADYGLRTTDYGLRTTDWV